MQWGWICLQAGMRRYILFGKGGRHAFSASLSLLKVHLRVPAGTKNYRALGFLR